VRGVPQAVKEEPGAEESKGRHGLSLLEASGTETPGDTVMRRGFMLIESVDTRATRLSSRSLLSALCAMLLLAAFISGYYWHGSEETQWQAGYDAASGHIGKIIREKMGNAELSAFYIADIGVHFYPRGSNIAMIKFRPTVENPTDVSPLPSYASRFTHNASCPSGGR
jgi:hypothetical protein